MKERIQLYEVYFSKTKMKATETQNTQHFKIDNSYYHLTKDVQAAKNQHYIQ